MQNKYVPLKYAPTFLCFPLIEFTLRINLATTFFLCTPNQKYILNKQSIVRKVHGLKKLQVNRTISVLWKIDRFMVVSTKCE